MTLIGPAAALFLVGLVVRLGLALTPYPASAQGGSSFEALPEWPADGKLDPQYADKTVFRDPRTEEIVISYPDFAGQPPGARVTYRFRPNNQVDPQIAINVARSPDGTFRYEYSIGNGQHAREPIESIWLLLPAPDACRDIAHATWYASCEDTALRPVAAAWQHQSERFVASWSSHGRTGRELAPSGAGTVFVVNSDYLPGLTTIYLAGGKALESPVGSVPPDVLEQLAPLLKPEVNWKAMATLGRRFGQESTAEIITDYRVGIRELGRLRRLSLSPPEGDIFRTIEECSERDMPGCIARLDTAIKHYAPGDFQGAILAAFRVALLGRVGR